MSPISAAIVYPSTQAIPGMVVNSDTYGVVGAEPAQLALALVDLTTEIIDQHQARLDRARPRLRQGEPHQQLSATLAEQISDRTRLPKRDQRRVNAILQRRVNAILNATRC